MNILVTGVSGYIGQHTAKALKEHGHRVIGTDITTLATIRKDGTILIPPYLDMYFWWDLSGDIPSGVPIHGLDVDVIVHLGGLTSVSESILIPGAYYRVNTLGTNNLLRTFFSSKIIFASTGAAEKPYSPYARSKVAAEDIVKSESACYTIFRIFNVAGGAFKSSVKSDKLMWNLGNAATGNSDFTMYGIDYDTKDGTCLRDYIHVLDVVDAICLAVVQPAAKTDYEHIASGHCYSVIDVVNEMRRVSGKNFSVRSGARREGDIIASCAPRVSRFCTPSRSLTEICKDTLCAFEKEIVNPTCI